MRLSELLGQIRPAVLGWIGRVLDGGGRDIGTPSTPFDTIYATSVTADTVLGTLAGAEWEHTGNMVIDANSASDTTVSVVNQGAGTVDFSVERNIAVGGTVDGVDVAAFKAGYDTHVANVNAHHNQQHSLDGTDHTGTLSWAKVSKTGSSLADLATRAHSNLTGIGANDHHAQSHVLATNAGLGADHTMSGATVGHVLRASSATAAAFAAIQDGDLPATIVRTSRQVISGAGLTGGGDLSADRTLAVGAGAGITVNADDVALTTPGGLSATSTNSASGNHTHAIDATIARSAIQIIAGSGLTGGGNLTADRTLNVGAGNGISVAADSVAVNQDYDFSWTGLHTFNDHTEMESVDVNGALTVLDDLSVFYGGYYPLFVNVDTVNPNNSNVGIMTNSPDSQFALDVNGPARAQYFIGPHALQLDDAAMIVHFDGPTPYSMNFDGSAVGHLGQVSTVTGGVIYRPGKFGKAIQIAEATTNLLLNPSFEYDSPGSLVPTQWSAYSNGTAAGTRDVVNNESLYGGQCLRLAKTGGATSDRWGIQDSFSATSGQSYAYSIWIKTSGTSGAIIGDIYMHGGAFVSAVSVPIYDTNEWARYTITNTASTTTSGAVYVWIDTAYSGSVFLDAAQVEQKSYATPYCDGSLGDGHSWSGTAHASTSSRVAGDVRYSAIDNIASSGTIAGWYYADNVGNYSGLLSVYSNVVNRLHILVSGSDLDVYKNTGSGSFIMSGDDCPVGEWFHVAFAWTPTEAKLYLNGVQTGSTYSGDVWSGITLSSSNLYIGNEVADIRKYWNGLIDDFVILNRAASADEIRAIYESNAPVFAESSITAWRTPSQVPIWVDIEGLWMRATGGGETLGAYGGDATKSWGGKTLYQSDFLIGNATDGYIHWHAYQDDADPWGAAGMEVQAQVDITGSSTISGTLSIEGVLAVSVSGTYKFWVQDSFLAAGPAAVNDNASFALIFQDATMIGTDVYSPTYDSGDVLIGNELAANVLWDQSAGQMLFRDNTTTKAYVDTDGSIKAGGGAVTLDDGGFALAVGTGTPNRIRWMASSTERASINGFDSGGVATISVLSGQNVATAYPGAISLTASEGGGSLGAAALSLDGPGNQAVVQFDDSDGRFKVQQTGPTVWLEVGPTNAQFAGALTLAELSSTPSTPTDGTQMRAYMKADKFVIQYNEGGTVRYKYLPLTSTGVTWVHTTTAP